MRSKKRPKTDPELTSPNSQVEKGQADLCMLPIRQDVSKLSVSEPVTRASSALFAPARSSSQPSGSGRRKEKSRQSSSPRVKRGSASESTSNSVFEPIVTLEDGDSWEQGVSAGLEQVQGELQSHSGMIYYLYPCHQAFL